MAKFITVHSYTEPIVQTLNKNGHLEHMYTGGKSQYHQHLWHSWGLGCIEADCEMNDHTTELYKYLRRSGY